MTTLLRLIDGSQLSLPSSAKIDEHFSNRNNYTEEIIRQLNVQGLYDGLVDNQDKIILDIGANIGLFALHVSPYADHIFCYEPTTKHYDVLKELTASESSKISCFPVALGPETGFSPWYEHAANTTMNSTFSREGSFISNKVVTTMTLYDLIKSLGVSCVDFCKIDIEGSEVMALDESMICKVKPYVKKFFIEFHDFNSLSYEQLVNCYKDYFENHGYNVVRRGPDALFCRK